MSVEFKPGIMMACGCAAQSMGLKAGEPESARRPACITHSCFDVAATGPDLTDRRARCAYFGKGGFRSYECNYQKRTGCTRAKCTCELPSDAALPFFEYHGPGSPWATTMCRHCKYYQSAHQRNSRACSHFEPMGDAPDKFFCGCAGWD